MRQYSTINSKDPQISARNVLNLVCEDVPSPFTAIDHESVLHALRRVAPQHPMFGCANGGCGICRIQVQSGEFTCGLMSAEQVSIVDRQQGIVLACRTYPTTDLVFKYLGKPN